MHRLIALSLAVALSAGSTQAAPKPAPVTAGVAPAVPWCPPGQAKDAAGKCVALAAGPPAGAKAPPYAKPAARATMIAAAPPPPMSIAVGEPNGDCTSRAPILIHDSRSPGGCAPCPRGRVPNYARQACIIPIPPPYRR